MNSICDVCGAPSKVWLNTGGNGRNVCDEHTPQKMELAELRARIKDLEAAQGARVPLTDSIGGNGCSRQSVKEMQPKPLEIEPNGRHEKTRGDSDFKSGNCGQIGRRDEVLSSGMQRGERAVCAEGGEDDKVTNGAGEGLTPPLAPPAPSAPSREPMTEADSDLRDIMPFDFESSDGELGPATISDNRGDIICTLNVDDAEFDGDPEGIIRLREKAMRYLTEVSRIGGVVVTDEMVDRAAQAAYESQTFATDLPWAEVKTDRWHRAARAALHSALGQGEE